MLFAVQTNSAGKTRERLVSLVWMPYGASAYEALKEEVTAAKDGDPLAPVTVIVPSQLCGVIARRWLARGLGDRGGAAGLSVLTVDRLAEFLAAPVLVGSGRRPATAPVMAAAWRRALAEDPGVFAPVAGHPTTVRALVEAHQELRDIDENALSAVNDSDERVGADVARLHRHVVELLAQDWYDTADLRRAAVNVLRAGPGRRAELGHVVVFLPQDMSLGGAALLRELAASGSQQVIAGATGDPRADRGVMQAVHRLHAGGGEPPQVRPSVATRILHASDADDEVRCVVRLLVERLQQMPGHRVAILYGAAEPYARLLAEHLHAAGIVWNGRSVRPTIERSLPRALLDLFALPDHGWRRDEVLAVLAAAPFAIPTGTGCPRRIGSGSRGSPGWWPVTTGTPG